MGLKLEEIENLVKKAIPDAEIKIEDLAKGMLEVYEKKFPNNNIIKKIKNFH